VRVSSTKYFHHPIQGIRLPHHGPRLPATSFIDTMTNRKLGSGRTHVTRQKHNKGTRPTIPLRSTEPPTLQWQSLLLLVTTTRVPAGVAARANTGRRLLRDTTRTRVARRGRSLHRTAPALMGPTTKDALRVETRRLLKRSGDMGWGTTVKWLSGLSLCVCVRTCFVGCLSKAPLFPSRALLK